MSCNKSLLNRDYSTWIKGVLTLFIILGHNMVFTMPLKDYGVMSYFYMFHIQGFFILPFLYGTYTKRDLKVRLKDVAVRFYWPFFLLVSGMTLVYGSINHFSGFTWEKLTELFLSCNGYIIKQMCGIQIFWFLPSMMMCVLLKEVYYRGGVMMRFLLLSISLAYTISAIHANTSYLAAIWFVNTNRYFPLGAGYAIQMLAIGVSLRALVNYINTTKCHRSAFILSAGGFLTCSLLYMKYVAKLIGHSDLNVVYAILQNITPLFFMIAIVCGLSLVQPNVRDSNVWKIGNSSLYIYLISPFVGYLLFFICNHLNLMYWQIGLLLWPVITYIAYGISFLISRKIERFLFPSDYSAWKRFFLQG